MQRKINSKVIKIKKEDGADAAFSDRDQMSLAGEKKTIGSK